MTPTSTRLSVGIVCVVGHHTRGSVCGRGDGDDKMSLRHHFNQVINNFVFDDRSRG